jgi:hypothetical protein
MAFSSAIVKIVKKGDFWESIGTWNGASVATGDVDTGLRMVFWFDAHATINGSVAEQTNIDETGLATGPIPGNAVTIDFNTSETGVWRALGYQ